MKKKKRKKKYESPSIKWVEVDESGVVTGEALDAVGKTVEKQTIGFYWGEKAKNFKMVKVTSE